MHRFPAATRSTSMSRHRAPVLHLLAIAASACLLGFYARGGHGHLLGFVLLVPWLLALNATRSLAGATLGALAMSLGFVFAVFAWFGAALHAYTGLGSVAAFAVLGLLAPLLQPQLIAFALARQLAARSGRGWLRAAAGACAWVACEWLWPKLLGDTLGHGLLPSALLRQAADLGGAAGLTVLLILVNEAIATAIEHRRARMRAWLAPAGVALALPLVIAAYGLFRLDALRAELDRPAPVLRIGLVQTGLVDYERWRAEVGSYAVVREVLDTHFALSRAAIEHHGADALLWSETVYPTTFGAPRSEDGAAFDREILDFVEASGTPLVFGTYERDADQEYNVAAFVEPGLGTLGRYRKTHPFPLTERVPPWLDRPRLRQWLPWMGTWQAGDGARVFPLRTVDGRQLNVVPLICLDDVDPQLAIDGARLGAQAIVGLSNDSWFSTQPLGAELHLAVAAFRSIETRLPQVRVTNNGLSALIDPSGEILVRTAMGDRAVLAGEIPLRDPPSTLMRQWGDWIGGVALAGLGLGTVIAIAARRRRRAMPEASTTSTAPASTLDIELQLLTPAWRLAISVLRGAAAAALIWIALRMLLVEGFQVNSLTLLRLFAWGVVLPSILAWAIARRCARRARVDGDRLVLQASQRLEIPLARLVALEAWRLPLPGIGADLVHESGRRWSVRPSRCSLPALRNALQAAGSPLDRHARRGARAVDRASLRLDVRHRWLDQAFVKFGLFALLLSLPAYRLHQHIAFGGTFGEWQTYGAVAWLSGLLIWWAAWSLGLMLFAAALRIAIEVVALATSSAGNAPARRRHLETGARCAFYLGLPAWLAWRVLTG